MLQTKTHELALVVIQLAGFCRKDLASDIVVRQLVRCATSTAANFRAVIQARSKSEFLAKLNVVLEEADETRFWLRLLLDAGIISEPTVNAPLAIAEECVAMALAARRTARARR